jgi:hypothetical protein
VGKFGFGSHEETADDSNKNHRQMEAAIGLYIAGFEVGRVDGEFDENERRSLSAHVMAIAANTKSRFVADAALICARWEEMRDVYNQDKRSHRDHLSDLNELINKLPKEDKYRYIFAFVSTTRVVGDASGGGWFNSEKFSEDEKKVAIAMWNTLFDQSDLEDSIAWVRQYGK